MTATPIGKFRKAMDGFLDRLHGWANSEQQRELEKSRLKYELGMKVNPRVVLGLFIDHCEPYADQILRGDDEYFLREHIEVEDEFQDLIVQLKQWWPMLESSQHKYIKDQIKLLLMLGAIATRNENIRLVINKYRSVDNPLLYD
jgi:hypothetical protein